MGLDDRDYFREEEKRYSAFGRMTATWPPVCKWLIIINIIVFILQIFVSRGPTDEEVMEPYADLPADDRPELVVAQKYADKVSLVEEAFTLETDKVLHGQIWRLISTAFLHDRFSVFHILFNLLLLFWFGRAMEQHYGSREFLIFYLAAAAAASLAYIGLELYTGTRMPALGASGAVMAVMMLYALHFPRQEIRLMMILPIQMRWLIMIYVIFDLHPVLLALSGGAVHDGVAHAAHLGGLAFGFLYFHFDWKLSKFFPERGARPSDEDIPSRRRPVTMRKDKKPEDPLSVKVDALLQKVSDGGMDSLTEDEREFLTKASQEYRERN